MTSKPFPHKCVSCRERAVNPVVVDNYTTELEHDGRAYTVSVPKLTVLVCSACGNRTRDHDANKRVVDALREQVGLLKPEEIRAKRNALGLSQKVLATHLRIAEATLSRWETGAQIQQRALDQLMRQYFDLPAAREYSAAGSGVHVGGRSDTEETVSPEVTGEVFRWMGKASVPATKSGAGNLVSGGN